MSTNLPGQDTPALEWLEARINGWVADPAGIGLTSAVVTDLATDIINRTNGIPADFVDVPCDACALWDDPDACVAPPPPVVNPPRITINFCGLGGTATMALTFSGLLATSLARRRRIFSTTTVREWPSSD